MDSEFWAAVVGASVGSISGGMIAWLLQLGQDRRQTSERNQALARSLIFKLIRIYSDLRGFKNHVDASEENAKRDELAIGWQSFRAIGNLPDKISFSPEEMSYLLSLKNYPLFDKVLSLDVIHASTLRIFELHKERRMALTDMLSATMSGTVGTSELTDEQKAFFDPKAAELDLLVSDIKQRVEQDAREASEALKRTNEAIIPTLGKKIEIEFLQE